MRRFSWRSAGDLAVTGAFAVLVVAGGVFAVRSGGSLARAATATPAELVGVAALTVRRRYPLPVLAVVVVFGAVAAAAADRTDHRAAAARHRPLHPRGSLHLAGHLPRRRLLRRWGAGRRTGHRQVRGAGGGAAHRGDDRVVRREHRRALAAVSGGGLRWDLVVLATPVVRGTALRTGRNSVCVRPGPAVTPPPGVLTTMIDGRSDRAVRRLVDMRDNDAAPGLRAVRPAERGGAAAPARPRRERTTAAHRGHHRLPDRPGGPHQRGQTRRAGAHPRPGPRRRASP